MTSGCQSGSNSEVSYNITHERISFQDSQQNDYLITAELFYPSLSDTNKSIGTNTSFPLIVFAHGYQQVYSDYQYLWEALVPQGYILAFLTTQQGLSIDIDRYSDDIIALQDELLHTSNTILAGHISNKSALMGHSTGGGAIYIAQAKKPQSTTLLSLAALGEPYGTITGTSPIDIANAITISTLILSGEKDCITPLEVHQKPLYDAFAGEKNMIIIEGGDHCGFSDSYNCPPAEALSCGIFFQGSTISEAEQRSKVLEHITPWLEKFLQK